MWISTINQVEDIIFPRCSASNYLGKASSSARVQVKGILIVKEIWTLTNYIIITWIRIILKKEIPSADFINTYKTSLNCNSPEHLLYQNYRKELGCSKTNIFMQLSLPLFERAIQPRKCRWPLAWDSVWRRTDLFFDFRLGGCLKSFE